MQSRLIVKNFGPIDFVDLDLRNVNVFIGPQASGKSALAKLYTIFKAPRKFIKNFEVKENQEVLFKNILEEYNIASFLKKDTEIEFDSELHSLSYKGGEIIYNAKLLKKIEEIEILGENFGINFDIVKDKIHSLSNSFIVFRFRVQEYLVGKDYLKNHLSTLENFISLTKIDFLKIVEFIKETEENLSANTSLYIPAERNFINIIKNAALNLQLNNVPIPKNILSFGAELEKASIKEIDLDFLRKDLMYKSINGEDRIFTSDNESIKLSEAASGVQSVLPILIPILSRDNFLDHRSFVIEEPELNLFPLAQYELIKLLESTRYDYSNYYEDAGTIHTYTTHSPYILSALNNLLYAEKIRINQRKNGKVDLEKDFAINKIISASINPNSFTAYQISNGKAQSIFNRETGLIDDNYIDEASDKMADDFDALMELMK